MDIWKETNFPDERNGVRRQSRGTKDQLIIDEMIMRNCNRRMKNLSATSDYACKKRYDMAYDMVPSTWILQYHKTFKVVDNIRNAIGKSMKNWKL